MTKVINFALTIGGLSIYSLEELRENFFADDVLILYRQGRLQRWLKCRGYQLQLDKVQALGHKEDQALIEGLADAFDVKVDAQAVAVLLQSMDFVKNKYKQSIKYMRMDMLMDSVAKTHYQQYMALIDEIRNNHASLQKLSQLIKKLTDKYFDLLSLDLSGFVYAIKDSAPLAILALLMNKKTRDLYECKSGEAAHNYVGFKLDEPWQLINQIVAAYPADFKHNVRDYIAQTDNHTWVELVSKGTKCMVLSCHGTCLVCGVDKSVAKSAVSSQISASSKQSVSSEQSASSEQKAASSVPKSAFSTVSERVIDQSLKPLEVNGRYPIFNGLMFKGDKDALVRYVIF